MSSRALALAVLRVIGEVARGQSRSSRAEGGHRSPANAHRGDLSEKLEGFIVGRLAGLGLQGIILRHALAHESPGGNCNGPRLQSVRNGSLRAEFAVAEKVRLANLPGDLLANIRQIVLAANRRDALTLFDI